MKGIFYISLILAAFTMPGIVVSQNETNALEPDALQADGQALQGGRISCPRVYCNPRICPHGCEKNIFGCLTSRCCPCALGCPVYRRYFYRNCWRCRYIFGAAGEAGLLGEAGPDVTDESFISDNTTDFST